MWITLIIAAVKAAMDYYQTKGTEKWQESVSGQLAQIITQLASIDVYLHSLPGIFRTELDNQTRKTWAANIQALVTDVNDLIDSYPNGPNSTVSQKGWDDSFIQLKTLIEENTDYINWGFQQFAIVAIGISAAAGLGKYGNNDRLFGSLVEHAVTYYQSAISPEIAGSFGRSARDIAVARANIVDATDPLFNKTWNSGYATSYSSPHGPGGSRVKTFRFAGSVEAGLGVVSESSVDGHLSVPFYPGTSDAEAEKQAVAAMKSAILLYTDLGQKGVQVQSCIDSCQAIIQELRRR